MHWAIIIVMVVPVVGAADVVHVEENCAESFGAG